jgi:hypothetical protein
MPDSTAYDVFNESLLYAKSIAEINPDQIKSIVAARSFCIVRGLIHPIKIIQSVNMLRNSFSQDKDRICTDSHPDRENYQRLVIGISGDPYSLSSPGQFFRVFYNPIGQEDLYCMNSTYSTMTKVRDLCMTRSGSSYTLDNDRLFTASRIHQYPLGGGFMAAHTDARAFEICNSNGFEYFQIVLVMSKKGIDFATGGAFVVSNSQTVLLDDFTEIGDIVIYDGNSVHGVAPIDTNLPLKLDRVCGRLSSMVTLFRIRLSN